MMEKQKNKFFVAQPVGRKPSRALAFVLIAAGLLFLLWNLGILSPGLFGHFFGSLGGAMGSIFGSLGGTIGTFFGSFGSAIGQIAGSLAGLLVRGWPLLLILLGGLLLLRRGKSNPSPFKNEPY